MYSTAEEAKKNHWFSRRHETEEAHRASGQTRREKQEEKRMAAAIRDDRRAKRSDAEQLALLESRGHGHCGEAISLRAKIEGS